jgi:hypothetical protein
MDQDGLSVGIFAIAIVILAAGLYQGEFRIQSLRAVRAGNPVSYWIIAALLVLLALESGRRAIFVGCVEC